MFLALKMTELWLHLLDMDLTSDRQYVTDVRSHHSLKISCLRMARLDGVGLLASCFFIHDQRFSMGLRSGELPGQSMTAMFLSSNQSLTAFAR